MKQFTGAGPRPGGGTAPAGRRTRSGTARGGRPSGSGSTPPPRRTRAGLSAARTQRRRWARRRLLVRVLLVAVIVVAVLGVGGTAAVYAVYQGYRSQLPDAAQLAAMEPPLDTHVYDRDGNQIAILHGDQRHETIALDHMSRWVRLATVDVEDRHFYEEGSWDLARMIKAGYTDIRGGQQQGASTITQQLAKVSFLGYGSRTLDYKAKEVILGSEIESNFSKDRILEMYMNRIEYGNHSVGVETAAQTYFHKSAHDLDLAESAMLAGLPNSPTALYPLNHGPGESVNPAARARQRLVLQAMVGNGDITQLQADTAAAETLTFHYVGDNEPAATEFTLYVQRWLQDHFGGAYLNPGGWEVRTTLSPQKQALAQKTVSDGVHAVADKNAHDGALVAMDPRTGEILALVGSADPANPEFGQFPAATSRLQPGSTIKLFTYTAAIASRRFTMRTGVVDERTTFRQSGGVPYTPNNYDRAYHGVCQLQVCLGNSFNIPAVKVEAKVGINYITDLEIAAGLESLAQPDNRPLPDQFAATLGALAHGVSPLELADGAGTIADLGVHRDPAPVLTIRNRLTRQSLFALDPATNGTQVVPANAAYIVDQMTSNDRNRLVEFGPHGDLTLPDRRVSAKTGTTEDFVSNWTVGWTPDLVTAVWVGNPYQSCLKPEDRDKLAAGMQHLRLYDGQALADPYTAQELARYGLQPSHEACGHLIGSTGITGAAPIWNHFMKAALGPPVPWYTKPADVLQDGTGDDAFYYIPGTVAANDENQCYHYGPSDSSDPCVNTGGSHSLLPVPTAPATAGPPAGASPKPSAAPSPSPGH